MFFNVRLTYLLFLNVFTSKHWSIGFFINLFISRKFYILSLILISFDALYLMMITPLYNRYFTRILLDFDSIFLIKSRNIGMDMK